MRLPKRPLVSLSLVSLFLICTPLSCSRSPDGLDRVLESGLLRVGMDASFPPFEYVDEEGNLVGYDVDLAREIAERLGVEPQFIANLPYDGLYEALDAGRVDVVISALYVDPTRGAAFTPPYFNAGQVLAVPAGEEEITGMEDLAGRTLAVEFGSEGDLEARSWGRRLQDLTLLPCQTAGQALERVMAGEADAALVDHLSALLAGDGIELVGEPITDVPYGIAVQREERDLLTAIQDALRDIRADGTLERLENRWFRPPPPSTPRSHLYYTVESIP